MVGSAEFLGPNEERGWGLAGAAIPILYIAWSVWAQTLAIEQQGEDRDGGDRSERPRLHDRADGHADPVARAVDPAEDLHLVRGDLRTPGLGSTHEEQHGTEDEPDGPSRADDGTRLSPAR